MVCDHSDRHVVFAGFRNFAFTRKCAKEHACCHSRSPSHDNRSNESDENGGLQGR